MDRTLSNKRQRLSGQPKPSPTTQGSSSQLPAGFLKLMRVCIAFTIIVIAVVLVIAVVTAPEEFDREETTENDTPLVAGSGATVSAVLGATLWSLAPTDFFSPFVPDRTVSHAVDDDLHEFGCSNGTGLDSADVDGLRWKGDVWHVSYPELVLQRILSYQYPVVRVLVSGQKTCGFSRRRAKSFASGNNHHDVLLLRWLCGLMSTIQMLYQSSPLAGKNRPPPEKCRYTLFLQ